LRKLIALFLMVILASFLTYAEIEKKYDRFTKKTTISTKLSPFSSKGPKLCCGPFIFEGEILKKSPKEAPIFFMSRNDDWEYLNCHHTYLLVDGEPVDLGEGIHHGEVGSGYVLEFIFHEVPFTLLQKLALAKKVEVKICNTEFVLTREDSSDLQEYIRFLTPGK